MVVIGAIFRSLAMVKKARRYNPVMVTLTLECFQEPRTDLLLQVCTVQQRHVAVPFETLESKHCFVTPSRTSKVQNASFSLHFGCSTRVVRATTSNFLATTLRVFQFCALLKNCLRGTFTTFGSTLRQLCKQPPGIRSGFCGIGFLKIAHFWWRMVCSQVICDQLEASYAKKDLRNGLFRRF